MKYIVSFVFSKIITSNPNKNISLLIPAVVNDWQSPLKSCCACLSLLFVFPTVCSYRPHFWLKRVVNWSRLWQIMLARNEAVYAGNHTKSTKLMIDVKWEQKALRSSFPIGCQEIWNQYSQILNFYRPLRHVYISFKKMLIWPLFQKLLIYLFVSNFDSIRLLMS